MTRILVERLVVGNTTRHRNGRQSWDFLNVCGVHRWNSGDLSLTRGGRSPRLTLTGRSETLYLSDTFPVADLPIGNAHTTDRSGGSGGRRMWFEYRYSGTAVSYTHLTLPTKA